MNTPRSKPPPRYSPPPPPATQRWGYDTGIGNHRIAALVGHIVTTWPHVEDVMIGMFQYFTGIPDSLTAQQIFRSIINQRTRIAIMKTMLQKSPRHMNAGPFFDEVIEEYGKLNTLRNTYAHGHWYTHEKNQVFFLEASDEAQIELDPREIKAGELKAVTDRMTALMIRILTGIWVNLPKPSPPKPPKPSSRIVSAGQKVRPKYQRAPRRRP